MLDAARDRHGEPLFVVKGGSALELRYESQARATRDIDLEFANAPSGHGRASGTADLDLVGVSVEDRNLADTAISCGRNSHRIEA